MPERNFAADYIQVNERISAFKAQYPDGSLQSELLRLDDSIVVMKAYAYRTPDDPRPGIGHSSLQIPGKTPYTRDSELENCETSAFGRALAALGFEVKRSVASAEEVRNKAHPAPAVASARERLLAVARAHGKGGDALGRMAAQIGVPAGAHASEAQIEQIIALIEQPGSGVPTSPATDAGAPAVGAPSQPDAGDTSLVPAPAASNDELLATALEVSGGELLPEKPDYVRKAEQMAAKVAAEKAGRARKTAPEPEPLTTGLAS